MKRILILVGIALLASASAFAQDDIQQAAAEAAAAIAAAPDAQKAAPRPNYWANSIVFDLGFNQTALANWASGGNNTISLAANVDGKACYAKNQMTWDNRLQMQYGFLWTSDKANLLQKSNDRLYLESKWAFKTGKESKWSYAASLDFRTQFSNTYDNYEKQADGSYQGKLKSGFLAPGYLNVGIGMDWDPSNWFDLSISPLTGGLTVVTIDALRKNYGMKQTADGGYNPWMFQLGAQIKTNLKFSINDKFNFESQLVAFYNYMFDYEQYKNFPVRVNWDNKISWQISRLFKIGLDTWLIYDPLVLNNAGDGPRGVQFKEFVSINFTYSIANPLAIAKAKTK